MLQYDRARIKDRHGDNDPHKRAKEIIKKLDINHDKKISKEEFIQGYALLFLIHFIYSRIGFSFQLDVNMMKSSLNFLLLRCRQPADMDFQ